MRDISSKQFESYSADMSVRRARPLALEERKLRSVKFPSLSVAVGFPDCPSRALVWQYQAEDSQYVERSHEVDATTYTILRRHSLDSWKPHITAADIKLRKDHVKRWIRAAHDSFCECGCSVQQQTASAEPKRRLSEPNKSIRAVQHRFKSLDDITLYDEESRDTRTSESVIERLKKLIRQTTEPIRLRSNSMTDLFATAVGTKKHWYRRSGIRASLASLGGSLPQLTVMDWASSSEDLSESNVDVGLPPEFRVTSVKFGSMQYSPPPRRASNPLVRFDLDRVEVSDTYPKTEYDRNGMIAKKNSEEMCEIRQELARFKLVEMEVSSYSRHNTHIFNDYQCGLTTTKMKSNSRLPHVA